MKGTTHILVLKKRGDDFYNSVESILQLFNAHDSIQLIVEDAALFYTGKKRQKVKCTYDIKRHKVHQTDDISFDVILIYEHTNKEEAIICDLIEVLIEALSRMRSEVKVSLLRHDIYRSYTFKAYREIFDTENKIRQFIYQLVAYKVGYSWIEAVMPDGIETRSGSQDVDESDFLHQIYLTDLTKILFKGQRDKDLRSIKDIELLVQRKLKEKLTTINVEELTGTISESLWSKHFSSLDKQGSTLESKLDHLAKLRNTVAHNKFIDRQNLGQVERLCNAIAEILNEAYDKIEEITFSQEDVDRTQEIIASVNQPDLHLEQKALWEHMNYMRGDVESFDIMRNDSLFDITYMRTDGKKAGVVVIKHIRKIAEAYRITQRLILAAYQEKCTVIDLIIVSYSHLGNLQERLNSYRELKFSDIQLDINVIYLNQKMDQRVTLQDLKALEKMGKLGEALSLNTHTTK